MRKRVDKGKILKWIYKRLFERYGEMGWWPATTRFEVAIGAILTQNTAWVNVEQAIRNLKEKGLLNEEALFGATEEEISRLIKPSGYYRIKAKRIKGFVRFLFSKYKGKMERMFKEDPFFLRKELLGINGIGFETADTILLYAGNVPIFVIDGYTRRILSRHSLINPKDSYSEVQNLFMENLPHDPKLFNEFHALFVQLGKEVCRKRPNCSICPIKDLDKMMSLRCDGCGNPFKEGDLKYILNLELYCAPDVELKMEDLVKDHQKEMKALLEKMERMSRRELEEGVYMKRGFIVCKRCAFALRQRISSKEFI